MTNGETQLNGIIFHSMPNGCIRQTYVQGFYFDSVTFKQEIIMYENMEISSSVY